MNKVNCEVIEDLLPIYIENMASPSSRTLVEEHLVSCENCRKIKDSMQASIYLPKDIDTKPLEKISKHLFKKKVMTISLTVLCMTLLAVLMIVHLNCPITIPYEEIADTIEFQDSDDDSIMLSMYNPGGNVEFSKQIGEDGLAVAFIRCYTTRWNQLTGKEGKTEIFQIGDIFDLTDKPVKRIYYYPSKESGEAICIYEAEDTVFTSMGVMVLPRLTLNYYILLAGILAIIGFLSCFIFRKDAKKFILALKISLFPVVYVISSFLVLSGKGEIYDAVYYFAGIMMVTIVAYIMIYWIIDYICYRQELKKRDEKMKKRSAIGLLVSALLMLSGCLIGKNEEIYSEYFTPIVQELEASWNDNITVSIMNKWWEKSLNVSGSFKEDKTFKCYIDGTSFSFNLEEELASAEEWHWEIAGAFANEKDGNVYLCLYDMNFLYEEGVVQNPQVILVKFSVDKPEDYQVTSYVVNPPHAVCWVNSCYCIGDDIYIAGEDELIAINMETMQLRDCKDEYSALKEYAQKDMDENNLHIYHFRAILKQGDVIIYSAQISEASDAEPIKTVYVAYKDGEAVAFMSVDLETKEISK